MIDNKPVLEFVSIFLKDSKKWAIPGVSSGLWFGGVKEEETEVFLKTTKYLQKAVLKAVFTTNLILKF